MLSAWTSILDVIVTAYKNLNNVRAPDVKCCFFKQLVLQ